MENAVGFVRRNLMVPIPSAEGWEALSDAWLEACDRIAGCEPWRKGERISVLFDAERAHMRPLPGVVFDACDWRSARCDKTGVVTVNAHRYLAGARYGRTRVRVGVRALSVEIRTMDNTPVVTLERQWGHHPTTQASPMSLLAVIARKPRIWTESPIRSEMPAPVRDLLDRMDAAARADLLRDIAKVSSRCGFTATMRAAATIISAGRVLDAAMLEQTARRTLQTTDNTATSMDLTRYDRFMHDDKETNG